MKSQKNHRGAGLVEVLVALLLLAIGVLGYVALQVRAVDASSEALMRSQAIMLMRGLTESMRANSGGQSFYPAKIRAYTTFTVDPDMQTKCLNAECTPEQAAAFDAYEAAAAGNALGISLTMDNCPGVPAAASVKRQCLFAAWGNTVLSATAASANYASCMNSNGVYVNQATCLMMEAY